MAEGVGFEPTVGFPTLDFESSALNRTQPPFLNQEENVERPTFNIQHRMQTLRVKSSSNADQRVGAGTQGAAVSHRWGDLEIAPP